MKNCNLSNFMKALEPWLSGDYIRKVSIDREKVFKLYFMDGVNSTYRIDSCSEAQFEDIIARFREKGIPVYKNQMC